MQRFPLIRERRRRVGSVLGAALASLAVPPAVGQSPEQPQRPTVVGIASQRRFVKSFDFDERSRGNLEPVPMLWFQIHKEGFPLYGKGGFDREVGHPSPPSFRLEPNGGNVAFQYRGKEIPIQPNSDYEISAWVRTEGLRYARASLRAFFMNRAGRLLKGSEHQTRPIRHARENSQWERVSIRIPGVYPDARFMGLAFTVEQPDQWDNRPKMPGHIERLDIHGKAWIDQIEVFRLPRVRLATTARGQIFEAQETPRLKVEVSDPDGLELSAKLTVRAAGGRPVLERPVKILTRKNTTPQEIALGDLEVGLYTASLEVTTDDRLLVQRRLNFAKVSRRVRPKHMLANGFGIVLDEAPIGDWRDDDHLLRASLAAHAKLPVWRAGMTSEQIATTDGRFYPLLQALARRRVQMVGVFLAPPRALGELTDEGSHPLVALFGSNPEVWQPFFQLTLSRYGPLIDLWQLGGDGDPDLLWDRSYPSTLPTFLDAIREHQPNPQLMAAWSIEHTLPPGMAQLAHLSLGLAPEIPPGSATGQYGGIEADKSKEIWALIQPLPPDRYHRIPRLEDFAKRLVLSHEGGVDGVFVRAPWRPVPWSEDGLLEPVEDYLIFRTVADVLHGSHPVGRFRLGKGVACRAFAYGSQTTLALWDPHAPPGGHAVSLPIGRDHHQVDIWGRQTPLSFPKDYDNCTITLTSTPVFVPGVQTWLARLLSSLELIPGDVETTFRPLKQRLRFVNSRSETLTGRFQIHGPASWKIFPNRLQFFLRPGETFDRQISIEYPYSDPSGEKILTLDMGLDAEATYRLQIPLPFRFGLKDITVRTMVQVDEEEDEILVRQQITNRSDEVVTLRGFVLADGTAHMRQLIPSLSPKRTVMREYLLKGARALRGQPIRVGVFDRDGARIYNEELVVP